MVCKTEQLLLDLGGEPSLTRDDLVVSSANLSAASLIDHWPEWSMPWAILVGGRGCGKTHLAEIWRQKSGAHVAQADNLNNTDLGLANDGHPILIDGLRENSFDEVHLFHLMNAIRGAGSSMLMTASSRPEFWPIKTPDLQSRLKAATNVFISEPDDALLRAVIAKLFSDRQILVDPIIVDFMLVHLERSLEAAANTVAQIDQLAFSKKTRITKQLVREAIEALSQRQRQFDF